MKKKRITAWLYGLAFVATAVSYVACDGKSTPASNVQTTPQAMADTVKYDTLTAEVLAPYTYHYKAEDYKVGAENALEKLLPLLREKYDPTQRQFVALTLKVEPTEKVLSVEDAGCINPAAMDTVEKGLLGLGLCNEATFKYFLLDSLAIAEKPKEEVTLFLRCDKTEKKELKLETKLPLDKATLQQCSKYVEESVALVGKDDFCRVIVLMR